MKLFGATIFILALTGSSLAQYERDTISRNLILTTEEQNEYEMVHQKCMEENDVTESDIEEADKNGSNATNCEKTAKYYMCYLKAIDVISKNCTISTEPLVGKFSEQNFETAKKCLEENIKTCDKDGDDDDDDDDKTSGGDNDDDDDDPCCEGAFKAHRCYNDIVHPK